jgi:polyisoprenoid-binding protein YceI
MTQRTFRFGVAALALATSVAAIAAANRFLDPKSTLTATFTQQGVPVEAPFQKFSGSVEYDPANPTAAKASLEVMTGSLDIGSPEYNEEVQGKKWFDVARFPKGTFVSTAVVVKAPGKLQATGNLTLKGKTAPVTVQVTVSKAGALTQFDGTFNLSRKAYGIDDPQWNDLLEDNVKVKFRLLQ